MEEKLRIAEILEEMRVDVIEAGFPIASNGDFEAVREVAKVVTESTVCGLARAGRRDIDRAAEALAPAKSGRIHTFISTSPLHMSVKLQMEPEDVHAAVIDSVSYARKFTDDVEWSCEDGSRTEHDFLCRCVESAIKAGAGTINIPDTVGYAVPEEFASLIAMLFDRVPNIDKAVLSVHCHNDLGLAVANSLSAVQAGARQVECTINGLGERAGNAAMEEIVMALRTRNDLMSFETGVKTENIMRASRLVSAVTGFVVQPNKAIVGANAFAHEAGIHQDGVLKDAQTYEIMTPESVGLVQSTLVMGKHSAATPSARSCGASATPSSATTRFRKRSCVSRTSPTRRKNSSTRTSSRWWTRKSPAQTTASSSGPSRCPAARQDRRRRLSRSRSTASRRRRKPPGTAPWMRLSTPSRRFTRTRPSYSFIRFMR